MSVIAAPDPRTGPSLRTRRQPLAQLLFCVGCCCGRVDRGRPEVPVDYLKSEWKRLGLNKWVQLTISGCLGPCDLPNVVAVLAPAGWTWLGNVTDRAQFETLVAWARQCAAEGAVAPLPALLQAHVFERFEHRPARCADGRCE